MIEKNLILKRYLKKMFEEKNLEIENFLDEVFDEAPLDVLDFFIEKFSLVEEIHLLEKRIVVENYLISLPKADEKTVKLVVEKMPEEALDSLISQNNLMEDKEIDKLRNKVIKEMIKKEMNTHGGISTAKKKELEKKVYKMNEEELDKYKSENS